jgi:hypothetical protein
MSKLRIKVSGCMRYMTGIEAFYAIRSCLATATRHGIPWLDALTRPPPGSPTPHKPALQQSADHPGHTRDLSSYSRVSVSCNVTAERRRCPAETTQAACRQAPPEEESVAMRKSPRGQV